jgi:hypothetical protein
MQDFWQNRIHEHIRMIQFILQDAELLNLIHDAGGLVVNAFRKRIF